MSVNRSELPRLGRVDLTKLSNAIHDDSFLDLSPENTTRSALPIACDGAANGPRNTVVHVSRPR